MNLQSRVPLSLFSWHDVTVQRSGRTGVLVIDDQPPVTGQSLGPNTVMDVGEATYLGGVPPEIHVPMAVGTVMGKQF